MVEAFDRGLRDERDAGGMSLLAGSGDRPEDWLATADGGVCGEVEGVGKGRRVEVFGDGRDGGGMSSLADASSGRLEVWLVTADEGGCGAVVGLGRCRRVEL